MSKNEEKMKKNSKKIKKRVFLKTNSVQPAASLWEEFKCNNNVESIVQQLKKPYEHKGIPKIFLSSMRSKI